MLFLQEAAAQYHERIIWIGTTTGLPDAILHIHAGMFIFLAASLLTGRSFDRLLPLLTVILLAGGNECLDRIHLGNWNWPDTKSDLINTIAWPLAIYATAHLHRIIRSVLKRSVKADRPAEAAAEI
ncbi:hypothetical protein [Sphingopyxis sp.]|uniref:hypothetical protein n=1 Tax=Sphingopyxis sp. TaxID=1908224 RepID=UPI002632A89B|nr:hypothetical protein [Sphingopyxis sp.]MCW0199994.1 hypothetical protein [Sphingopyxis sp.]